MLGAAQAGRRSSLRLLRLLADEELIRQAREDATAVVAADPDLVARSTMTSAPGASQARPARADSVAATSSPGSA